MYCCVYASQKFCCSNFECGSRHDLMPNTFTSPVWLPDDACCLLRQGAAVLCSTKCLYEKAYQVGERDPVCKRTVFRVFLLSFQPTLHQKEKQVAEYNRRAHQLRAKRSPFMCSLLVLCKFGQLCIVIPIESRKQDQERKIFKECCEEICLNYF